MGHRGLFSGLVFWYLNGLVEGGSAQGMSPALRRDMVLQQLEDSREKVARLPSQRFENIPLQPSRNQTRIHKD